MRLDGVDAIDCLVGNKIALSCDKAAAQIAKETHNQQELALVTTDMEKCLYVRAGCRAYADKLVDNMLDKVKRFMALAFSLYGLLGLSGGTLTGLLALRSFERKSRGMPASSLHDKATGIVFPGRRMLSIYAVAFLACSASTLLLVSMPAGLSPAPVATMFIGIMIPFTTPLYLYGRARKQYKETYNHLAEESGAELLPKKIRLMAIQDRREITRRLVGLDGGLMVTMTFWGLLLSMGLRLCYGAYPWQITKAMGGMPQAEMRYVKDLVDGKVKVPQKYIDQIKREEARFKKQTGGSK